MAELALKTAEHTLRGETRLATLAGAEFLLAGLDNMFRYRNTQFVNCIFKLKCDHKSTLSFTATVLSWFDNFYCQCSLGVPHIIERYFVPIE